MDPLGSLLWIYVGVMVINTITSFILWYQSRSSLQRNLLFTWLATLINFIAQGATPDTPFGMAMGFAPVILVELALTRLLGEIIGRPLPYRRLLIGFAVGLAIAIAIGFTSLPFFAIATPLVIGAALPLSWLLYAIYRTGSWSRLTISGKGLVIASTFHLLHMLNVPVLRDRPEFAMFGFTMAILIIFALSLFASSAVLEIATMAQAKSATELELARHIQVAILPRDPIIHGLELACHMQPAEEVAGDYYDVYSFGDHSWMLLGDVTGHGLSSGLVMLMAQSTISALLHARPEMSPSDLAYTANSILYRNLRRLDERRTMTLVAITRDLRTGEFRYCGASEHIYIVRHTGEVEVLMAEQMPHALGMLDEFPRNEYGEANFSLLPGDLLFVTTDGIIEAPASGDYALEMFGEERLIGFLIANRTRTPGELSKALLATLETYTRGVYQDDISFVVARAN